MMRHEDDLILVERSRHWLDDFARRHLDPALKQHGFSRRGRNWNRRTDDLVHVLHIQAGRFGPGISGSTGVFAPSIHRIIRGESSPKFVADHLCQLHTALGHWGSGLRFEQVDPHNANVRRVHFDEPTVNAPEVLAVFLKGVSALDEVRSIDDVWNVLLGRGEQSPWSSGGPSGSREECLAVLAAQSGEKERAREFLLTALSRTPSTALSIRGPHYQALADRLGIAL